MKDEKCSGLLKKVEDFCLKPVSGILIWRLFPFPKMKSIRHLPD
jgi:hypothetical protein